MDNFQLFLNNQWGLLHKQYLFLEPTDEINKAIHIAILVWWWQKEINSEEVSISWSTSSDDRMIFLVALINLGNGKYKKFKEINGILVRRNNHKLLKLLKIYEYGLSNDVEKIINFLESKDDCKLNLDETFTPIINSLLNDALDYGEFIDYLKALKSKSLVYEALLVKLNKSTNIDLDKYFDHDVGCLQYQIGLKLWKNCEFKESLVFLDKAANNFYIDKPSIRAWLNTSLCTPEGKTSLINRVKHASIASPIKRFKHEIETYLIINSWIDGNYELAYELVKNNAEYLKLDELDEDRNMQIFFIYTLSLCVFWQKNRNLYEYKLNNGYINCIGESHSLSPTNTIFQWRNKTLKAKTSLIMGIKMWHLANENENIQKKLFLNLIDKLDKETPLLITIGEIDSRPNEGIWKSSMQGKKDLNIIIKDTVDNYLNFLKINLKGFSEITIQGIPAPGYKLIGKRDPINRIGFLQMIKEVNIFLEEKTLTLGWGFFDVYAATVSNEGDSNSEWHLDGFHLKPSIYQESARFLKFDLSNKFQ